MADITLTPTQTFISGDTVLPATLNQLAQSTVALTAGTIVDADVSASAAILPSKLGAGALPAAVTVASANLVDGTIVNADINATAAIAGTKIDPDFGAQAVDTTGNVTASRLVAGGGTNLAPSITFTGDGNTGIFHPAEATIAFSKNATEVMRINSDGDLIVNNTTPVNVTTGTADFIKKQRHSVVSSSARRERKGCLVL
jgi:hypothetical protein